jgi:hypothetical protein
MRGQPAWKPGLRREAIYVDSNELVYARGVLVRLAQAAHDDRELARHVRELVTQTGILQVFRLDGALNLAEIVQAGGPELLRAQLDGMGLAELKQIVAANQLDPEKTSARWRSSARFVDLIVARAAERFEQPAEEHLEQEEEQEQEQATVLLTPQPKPVNDASWML